MRLTITRATAVLNNRVGTDSRRAGRMPAVHCPIDAGAWLTAVRGMIELLHVSIRLSFNNAFSRGLWKRRDRHKLSTQKVQTCSTRVQSTRCHNDSNPIVRWLDQKSIEITWTLGAAFSWLKISIDTRHCRTSVHLTMDMSILETKTNKCKYTTQIYDSMNVFVWDRDSRCSGRTCSDLSDVETPFR